MLIVMVAWFGSGIQYMRSIPFERIFDPTDSYGNVCGTTQPSLDLSRRPLLLHVPLLNGSTLAVCVAACPEGDVVGSGAVQDIFLPFCSYDANHTETYSELVAKGQCPIAVQRSVGVSRRCLSVEKYKEEYEGLPFSLRLYRMAFEFMWPIIYCMCFGTALSIVWLVVLTSRPRFVMLWTFIGAQVGLLGLALYCWLCFLGGKDVMGYNALFSSIVASLLAGFAIYLFRSFGPEMERTARLVRCAGSFMFLMPASFIIPCLELVLFALVSAFAFAYGFYAPHLWWLNLLGFYWTAYFIFAMSQTLIAGAVSLRYFQYYESSEDRSKLTNSFWVVRGSFSRFIRCNVFPVAVGAMLITFVVELVGWCVRRLDQVTRAENPVAKCLCRPLAPLLSRLRSFFDCLTFNTYIEVAVRGSSFMDAVYSSSALLSAHSDKLAAFDTVLDLLVGASQFILAAMCAANAAIVVYFFLPEGVSFASGGPVPVFFVYGCCYQIVWVFSNLLYMVARSIVYFYFATGLDVQLYDMQNSPAEVDDVVALPLNDCAK